MQSACEICGNPRLRKKHAMMGTSLSCGQCGARFFYYYMKNGQLFEYPSSWGKAIAYVSAPEPFYEFNEETGESREISRTMEDYYIFVSDDGTIRRVRIEGNGRFDDEPSKPKPHGVPKPVELIMAFWVDVLPRRDDVHAGGERIAAGSVN